MLSRSPNPAALSANTDYKRRPLAPALGKPVRKIPKKRELIVSVVAAEEHCNCGSEPAREGRSRAGSLPQIGLDLQQSIYRDCAVHANRTGRSAASGRSAFDLPAPSGGREEVMGSGSTGMDAGRAAMGHGWPIAAGPRSRTGAREPERSEGRTPGQAFLVTFSASGKSDSL